MKTAFSALALVLLTSAAPAIADVKDGVDAWSRGDYRKAVEEWRGPAIAGDADAQFNLGQAYKLGRGVPVDLGMAEEWYRKAAVQGHPQAEDNYGLALFQNNKRDQAVPWLTKSADRGEARAQFVLGTMLFNGDAVPRDWVRAYALMTRASSSGLPQATTTLAQMDRYIGLKDRQKGTELARQLEMQAGKVQFASDGTTGPVAAASPPRTAAAPTPIRTTPLPPSRVDQPMQVITPPRPRPVAPVPTPVAKAPAPAPAKPTPKPAPVVAAGDWRVQLGAFRDPDGARRLWSQVAGRFPGRQPSYVKAGAVTRLLVGPYASQSDAARGCAAVKPCVPTRG